MLLEIKDLAVRYGGAEVLRGVSVEVEEGSVVTLLGGNGAGKSPTLRAITGLVPIASGEIWFDGRRIDGLAPQKIVELGVRHVLEGRALFPYMTVLENLKVGAYLQKDRGKTAQMLKDIFVHFPRLEERQGQQARTLSGGEQQMLPIARALVGGPRLLLLDEPSLGLSPLLSRESSKSFRNIHERGVTVLLVEQNTRLALDVADRCYVLETGNIVACGRTQELIESDLVRKAYLGA